jgi:pimeloyl-ACP methyl ester carboxylesterase
MQRLCRRIIASALLLLTIAGPATAQASAREPQGPTGCLPNGQVAEQDLFVVVGGIEQWVTIRGTDCANPLVLFIHGGPGNPMSPFADAVYAGWEDEFTLIQWDQRGAGRTWGRNPTVAEADLSIVEMAADGVELAAWVAGRLRQDKVILVGGSWGSALAVKMARARPDLFHAYVGSGQLVSGVANLEASYRLQMGLARTAGDTETIAALEAMGPPPWTNPRNFGALRRLTRRYEAKTTTPPPADWWIPAPAYTTAEAEAAYEGGEEHSYIQFVGFEGEGMLSGLDLLRDDLDFAVPVFLIQGDEDLVTVPEVAQTWFDAIRAPQKAFVRLPATGHDPNDAMIEAQRAVLREQVVPLIR